MAAQKGANSNTRKSEYRWRRHTAYRRKLRNCAGGTQQSISEIFPRGSMSRSEELIQELESSDYVVIGTPMHNFTVPSALKAWIDHIVRVRRTFNPSKDGYVGVLRDRPVFVAVSSGGRFSGERARQPDLLTPYLKAVLGVIGLHDLTFFSAEGSSLAWIPWLMREPR